MYAEIRMNTHTEAFVYSDTYLSTFVYTSKQVYASIYTYAHVYTRYAQVYTGIRGMHRYLHYHSFTNLLLSLDNCCSPDSLDASVPDSRHTHITERILSL